MKTHLRTNKNPVPVKFHSLKRNLLSVAVMLQLGFAPNVLSTDLTMKSLKSFASSKDTSLSYEAIFLSVEKELIIPSISVNIGGLIFSYSVKLQQSLENDSQFILSEIKDNNAEMTSDDHLCSAVYSIETGELYIPCAETGTPTLLYADNITNPTSFSVTRPEINSIARRSLADYPYKSECPSPSGGKRLADKWNFIRCECTSYVAAMLTRDGIKVNSVPFTNNVASKKIGNNLIDRWGDAVYWKDKAISLGFTVDKNPKKGDVAWWASGHVAYVESVNSGGSVNVSEYNITKYNFGTRTNLRADAYIHFISPKLETVSTLNINPNPIVQNQSITVTARIKNNGTAVFNNGSIAVALHKATGEYLGDIQILTGQSIGIGQEVSLSFKKSTISFLPGNYLLRTKFSSDNNVTWNDISDTPIKIIQPPVTYPVTTTVNNVNMGKVTSSTSGINCGLGNNVCSSSYTNNSVVTLTATPNNSGYIFTGWSGACSGSNASCSITVNASKNVTANFSVKPSPKLSLSGNNTINPNPIIQGQAVSVVTTVKNSGTSIFDGYVAAALHKTTGEFLEDILISSKISIGINKEIPLTLKKALVSTSIGNYLLKIKSSPDNKTWTDISSTPIQITSIFPLSVNNTATSMGKVTSLPIGINCGQGSTICKLNYTNNTIVQLTAIPNNSGYIFSGWSGACSGSNTSCSITVNASKNVTANFSMKPSPTFALSIDNSTMGKVTSSSGGINCGSGSNLCSASYANSSVVTLTASPNNGYAFSNWSGACSGSNVSCSVRLDGNKTVTANFVAEGPSEYKLTAKAPEHGKIVTYDYAANSPNGLISCGGGDTKCVSSFKKDTSVRFVIIPDAEFKPLMWFCAGGGEQNGECVVTVNSKSEQLTTTNPITVPAFEAIDNESPNVTISGLKPEYMAGDWIEYSLSANDNKELYSIDFVIKDANQVEKFSKRFSANGTSYNTEGYGILTTGWEAGEYNYSYKATDAAKNESAPQEGRLTVSSASESIRFVDKPENKNFYGFAVDNDGKVVRTNTAISTVLISGETTHSKPMEKTVISLHKQSDDSLVGSEQDTGLSTGNRNDFLKTFYPAAEGIIDGTMLYAKVQIIDANKKEVIPPFLTFPFLWCRNEPCTIPKYKLTLLPIGQGNVNWSTDKGNSGSSPLSTTTLFTRDFDAGTQISLTKGQPVLDFKYGGFTETPCTGQSTCNITMDSDKTIVVTFSGMSDGHFSISRIGRGSVTNLNTGTVIVNDNMLSSSSNALYKPKGIYTLKAQANTGYTFKKWIGGDCTEHTQLECNTNFTGTSQAIVAIFEPNA